LSKKKGVWPVGRCFSCWCSNPQLSSGKKISLVRAFYYPM
jgi:hypothetical protein